MVTTKSYYKNNKEAIRAYQKKYREEHPEKWHNKNKLWREANPEKAKAYMIKYNTSPRGRFTKLKLRAKVANIPVDIKVNEFIEWIGKQESSCYYCKAEMAMGSGQKKMDGYSIDRKDNNLGYSLDNIVLSCNRCNMAKGSWFTEEQMLEIAHKYFQYGR